MINRCSNFHQDLTQEEAWAAFVRNFWNLNRSSLSLLQMEDVSVWFGSSSSEYKSSFEYYGLSSRLSGISSKLAEYVWYCWCPVKYAGEVTGCLINYMLWLGQILPLCSNRKRVTLVVHYNVPFQQHFWHVVFFLLDYESRCLCLRYWTRHCRQPTIYDVIPQVCTYP